MYVLKYLNKVLLCEMFGRLAYCVFSLDNSGWTRLNKSEFHVCVSTEDIFFNSNQGRFLHYNYNNICSVYYPVLALISILRCRDEISRELTVSPCTGCRIKTTYSNPLQLTRFWVTFLCLFFLFLSSLLQTANNRLFSAIL